VARACTSQASTRPSQGCAIFLKSIDPVVLLAGAFHGVLDHRPATHGLAHQDKARELQCVGQRHQIIGKVSRIGTTRRHGRRREPAMRERDAGVRSRKVPHLLPPRHLVAA
jgi:hypothetical protein